MKAKQSLFALTTIAISMILVGCATKYKPIGFLGEGYSEIRTKPDSFIVTFKGNSATPAEKVYQYALTRASEITLNNGYKYFHVTSNKDQSRKTDYKKTHTNSSTEVDTRGFADLEVDNSSTVTSYTETVVRPAIYLEVKCFAQMPESLDVIDAKYFLDNNPR